MKRLSLLALLLAGTVQAAELPDWSSLQWLAGCWQQIGAEAGSVEHWLAPAGGVMLGVSRTVRKGRVVEYEFMRIHDQDGERYYSALPSGQAGASFKLVSSEAQQLVFENPDHDFPQKISYQLRPDGSLFAQIAGTRNGKVKTVDFPMNRIKCD